MNHPYLFYRLLLATLLVSSFVLTACANRVSSDESSLYPPTEAPTAEIRTSSGYTCPEPSPRMAVKSTQLNLFVWSEYFPDDLVECFELVYGVDVNRDEYASNEEMYAKLAAGNANYDLVQPSDYMVPLMIRQGLLQELDKNRLTVLGNFNPDYLNQKFDPNNNYTLPYQAGTFGIIVNTDKVKNIPQSWQDLWKPEYAGHMVFVDAMRGTIGMTLLTLGYDINSKDPAQLEEAKTKLAQLTPGIKLFDSDSPQSAVIAGDADLGMVWTGNAVIAKREMGSIEYVYPKEGTIVWFDNYAIPNGAPHEDALYAWLNYTLQGDPFWMMLRDFPYTNPNQAALEFAKAHQPELYQAYIDSPITNTPSEVIATARIIDDVGEATPLYDRIWTEVKGR